MKDIGYGKNYAYDHDAEGAFSGQDYWPEGMNAETFYEPTDRGFETRVRERLAFWAEKRREKQIPSDQT
jgi:putative ATPase